MEEAAESDVDEFSFPGGASDGRTSDEAAFEACFLFVLRRARRVASGVLSFASSATGDDMEASPSRQEEGGICASFTRCQDSFLLSARASTSRSCGSRP